jgi:hypothetical protein
LEGCADGERAGLEKKRGKLVEDLAVRPLEIQSRYTVHPTAIIIVFLLHYGWLFM